MHIPYSVMHVIHSFKFNLSRLPKIFIINTFPITQFYLSSYIGLHLYPLLPLRTDTLVLNYSSTCVFPPQVLLVLRMHQQSPHQNSQVHLIQV